MKQFCTVIRIPGNVLLLLNIIVQLLQVSTSCYETVLYSCYKLALPVMKQFCTVVYKLFFFFYMKRRTMLELKGTQNYQIYQLNIFLLK